MAQEQADPDPALGGGAELPGSWVAADHMHGLLACEQLQVQIRRFSLAFPVASAAKGRDELRHIAVRRFTSISHQSENPK